MGLAAITDTGRHPPTEFRRVDPPRSVLVDLATLFPRQPHSRRRYQPGGLQMHLVVRGQLTCWARSVHGDWWALVTYPVAFGQRARPVTHWVPAWVLKPDPAR